MTQSDTATLFLAAINDVVDPVMATEAERRRVDGHAEKILDALSGNPLLLMTMSGNLLEFAMIYAPEAVRAVSLGSRKWT